jgi:pimeloyl-ACP methyl ester carboxylesterase
MQTEQQILSGSAALAADVIGSGSPVVFLHAAVCDSRMWRAQLDAVAATHLAIAYDRRGFGRTTSEQEDHSAVGDLLTVIDTVAKGAPAILVACSQGGRVALDAALLHPARIRGLVLISPSVSGAPDPLLPPEIQMLVADQKTAEAAGDLDRVNTIKAHLWLDGPLQPDGRVAGSARQLFLDMNGIALRAAPVGASLDTVMALPRLGEIAAPALVICGDADFPHIHARSRNMAAAMQNATFQSLPGVAHLPSLERPAEITRLLLAFLARV